MGPEHLEMVTESNFWLVIDSRARRAFYFEKVEPRTVTVLLRSWRDGNRAALDELAPIIYMELRRLASRSLRGERPNHTLRPTDLVGEAYLRLIAGAQPEWTDRVHFFAVAARYMRQILVDHARRRLANKRGGGARPVELEDSMIAIERPNELVALDEALIALAALDERKARVLELHYFTGLSQAEIAEVVGVHVNTVARDLRLAEAWIHRFVRDEK
jgi:RNA polymerase sigma factor (TIGR02999 family)